MFIPKQKHRVLLLMCIAVIVLGLVAFADAQYKRPNNETMSYAPQNVGIYDTYYCNFKESDCRSCHGTTTAWRHHNTDLALSGQCATTCHLLPYNPYTNPERDCKECHIDGTWVPVDTGQGVGNLGNPHHKSSLADANRCTGCHESTAISDPNTVYVPQFDPTDITPTPYSCENCHWPTGLVAHGAPPLADWSLWVPSYGPKPTTWPDNSPHPAPIEANGPVTSGNVIASDPDPDANKPYRPDGGTHHEIDGVVVAGNCNLCHATSPGGDYRIDFTDPLLIRGCENCHDIFTLHDTILEHTTDGIGGSGLGGYTVGGVLDQVVVMNQKCVACHGDGVISGPMPTMPASAPVIALLEPPTGSAGITVSIIAGTPDFGPQYDDDRVAVTQGSTTIFVPIVSWNPDKIEILIPGETFTPGTLSVQVDKSYWTEDIDSIGDNDSICEAGEVCTVNWISSAARQFLLRQHPILTSLSPSSGTWGTDVTINGMPGSFGNQREEIYTTLTGLEPPDWAGYGYSTYVELVASNDNYRVTEMSGDGWTVGLAAWNPNAIQIRIAQLSVPVGGMIVGNLVDLNLIPPKPVPLADLYKGNWQLFVITDYFKDDGDGQYMLKKVGGALNGHLLGKIDTGDTLLYREVSDPLSWYATDTPYISSVSPTSVQSGNLFAIYGYNFGTTQVDSFVKAGACNPFSWIYTFPGTPASAKVYQWSNTRIILEAPTVGSSKTGCLKVHVEGVLAPGSKDSNASAPVTVYP